MLPLRALYSPAQLQRRGPAKKIIVIGAGLAGLSAGFAHTSGPRCHDSRSPDSSRRESLQHTAGVFGQFVCGSGSNRL
jgi:hypothetical protein